IPSALGPADSHSSVRDHHATRAADGLGEGLEIPLPTHGEASGGGPYLGQGRGRAGWEPWLEWSNGRERRRRRRRERERRSRDGPVASSGTRWTTGRWPATPPIRAAAAATSGSSSRTDASPTRVPSSAASSATPPSPRPRLLPPPPHLCPRRRARRASRIHVRPLRPSPPLRVGPRPVHGRA